MGFSDNLKAYLEAHGSKLVLTILEVEWLGDEETGRYASGYFSHDDGQYDGLISKNGVSGPSEGVDPQSSSIRSLEASVELIDVDRSIQRILEGPREQRRAAVTLYWGVPSLARADWNIRLRGILDSWTYRDGGLVVLQIRTDDRFLDGPASRWPAVTSEWAELPDKNRNVYLPAIFGVHLSNSLSARGFIPTIYITAPTHGAKWQELVSLGYVNVTAVYRIRADVASLMTLTTDYIVVQTIVGGKALTLVEFTPAAAMLEDDTVQVDVEGLTELGDGTGTMIANPVTQLRLFLVNFGHGSWLSGDWLSEDDSPIEPTSWAEAEAYAARYRLEGSFRVGGAVEQRSVLDVINEWLGTWTMFRPYWTPEGELAMGVMRFDWPEYGEGGFFELIREDDVVGRPQTQDDTSHIISRVSATHLFDIAGSKNWGSVDVQDVSREERSSDRLQMTDSVSKFG
jgi:hypothetical protein